MRKKSLMVCKGVIDVDECLPLVCKNKLPFSVDLAIDSKSVVGGQCTAGWPECKEENCGSSIVCGLGGKGYESFIDLENV